MEAYLDNSATTCLCPTAKEKTVEAINKFYGNPSSLHSIGTAASRQLEAARAAVAATLACESEEIVFTNSGTLANNAAIFGAAHALRRRGNRIVTTAIEHPSVLECMKALEKEGFEVIYLKPDRYGRINRRDLMQAVNAKTVLVSMMYVNNEVGSILPVEAARAAVRAAKAPALIHCDAVQAYGKLAVKPSRLGVDLLTASGHKINGPKGVGFLYVRKGVRLAPYILGGGQEGKIYSGTQPMPTIMGLWGAVEELPDPNVQLEKTRLLRDYFVSQAANIEGLVVNSCDEALPYIINISLPGHPSQTVLNFLSERGIYVSGGSACSKGHRSHVLTAMGLEPELTDSALRISLCRFTTKDEIDMLLCGLDAATVTLRKKK